jgi:hypothetical protein
MVEEALEAPAKPPTHWLRLHGAVGIPSSGDTSETEWTQAINSQTTGQPARPPKTRLLVVAARTRAVVFTLLLCLRAMCANADYVRD